jgi:hypothetical protein
MIDDGGNEQGAPLNFASGCSNLARVGSKWSFLELNAGPGTSLVVFDGTQSTEMPLAFSKEQYAWDRVVFDDGSFVVSGFWEDVNTQKTTNWLTPFDAHGNPLNAGAPVLGFDSAPVILARAGDQAMAGWNGSTIEVMPVDAKAQSLGATQTVTTDTPVYELSMFAEPNGDVLVAWIVLGGSTNDMSLHARVVAPDGTPRGPETLLESGLATVQIHGAIESTGARAVLVVTTNKGKVEALPLTCQ